MTAIKVPVLITQYATDLFVAKVVDGPGADVSAPTASEAYALVQRHLKQQAKREPYQYWPKIDKYDLRTGTAKVRLFYRDGKRQFPASREMKIPIRYVVGEYVDNSVECFLTDFDIVFHCPAIRELPQLIDEAVRGAAARVDSRFLAASTPPPKSELRIVRLRLKKRKHRSNADDTETLAIVADPIDKPNRKRKSSVPIRHRDKESIALAAAIADSSVLLVGDAGCGKTSIVKKAATLHRDRALAEHLEQRKPPPPPLVWESSAENLIAGMQYLGEWEQRLEEVISNLESIGGILFVTSQIDLVRLGGSLPTNSLAAFLMPYMQRGELKLVTETTPEELDAARRLLPGWIECFRVINVPKLNHEQTRDIADTMLNEAARNHRLEVDEAAGETATRLFAQFMPYQSPPKGVVQLVSDVIGQARQIPNTSSESEQSKIGTSMVVNQFTRLTGLPESILKDSLTMSGDEVRGQLQRDVIGQESAVRSASNVVLRLKAGLCDSKRPISTMLFCGPTGVGKTQLARTLGDFLFGQAVREEKTLIRLDMSEYASWDSVDRFMIGADGEVATWIARLRERPMSVVLFDEFEKGSSEVHDCLLSGLDEGRITDRFGRTTTLCGAIVILTSNVGSKSNAQVGFQVDDRRALNRAIEQEFRPEFLNRLDEIVTFDPLSEEHIQLIVEKELKALAQRETLRMRRVKLTWDESVVQSLASIGFDPLLGARPLQRAIEREVVAKVARQLLETDHTQEQITIDLRQLIHTGSVQDPN